MGCEGYGYYDCLCGGDLCVCENNGEEPCFGCDDCMGSLGVIGEMVEMEDDDAPKDATP